MKLLVAAALCGRLDQQLWWHEACEHPQSAKLLAEAEAAVEDAIARRKAEDSTVLGQRAARLTRAEKRALAREALAKAFPAEPAKPKLSILRQLAVTQANKAAATIVET